MQKPSRAMLVSIAITLAIAGALHLWNWLEPACSNEQRRIVMKAAGGVGCFEFWFNRYQTTLQTIFSTVLAGAGLYFVIGQLRGLTEQNAMTAAALDGNRREQAANRRLVIARGLSGLNVYGAAATMLLIEATRQHETNTPPKQPKDMGDFGNLEQASVDVYAVLPTPALRAHWRRTRNRFTAAMTFIALHRSEWAQDKLKNTTFGEIPMPSDLEAAMLEIGTMVGEINGLREYLEASIPGE